MENDFIKHQIYLNRYGSSLYKEALPELKKLRDEISAKLLATPSNTFESARLGYLLRDLKIIIDTTINGAINPKLFEDLALYEQEFALKVLDGATPASVIISGGINAAVLIPEVMASTMQLQGVKGKQTIEDVIKTFSDAHYKDIESEIRRGISEGLTTDEIVDKIKYLSDNRTKAQCEAVIRTLTNHVATTARSATFKEYEDLFIGEKFLATLDSRTTIQCGVRDGGVWTFDGKPINVIAKANAYKRPPLHFQCRSVLVSELKPQYDLNIDSTRSSEFGQVSDNLTYQDWLKKQSASFQDDVLGKTRGKLFRDGTLTLEKFTDKKDAVLTLKELGAKEGVAKVVIPKATIPTIKFGYDGKFDGYVANIRDEAKIVIDKLPKPKITIDGRKIASYNNGELKIIREDLHNGIFLHEYGHHIDNILKYKSDTIKDEIKKDLIGKDISYIANYVTEKGYDKTTIDTGRTIKNKLKSKSNDSVLFSDILDSATKGKLTSFDNRLDGHGENYFIIDGYDREEIFANLFSLWANKSKYYEYTKEIMPFTVMKFEKIIDELIQ